MTNKQSQKRGIALVIVLGMLALLVMLGVAFSVFMRTERHAAGAFQHDVRARVLLQAAATRAIEDLDANLANRFYPDWLARASQSANTNRLSTNEVWATQVPGSLLDDAQFPSGFGWIDVPINGRPVGRVGYVIVNASGLLDANSAGGSVRASGGNPNEINIDMLSEITTVANAKKLTENRTYESVGEMRRMGSGIGVSDIRNLVTFSMSPTNVLPVPIDMSKFVTENDLIMNSGNIISNLTALLQGEGDVAMAFDALIDYVDENSIPKNLNEPCTERVPMINEVRCQPFVIGSPVAFMLGFDFNVELFYPFIAPVYPNPSSYTLKYKYSISSTAGFPTPPPVESSAPLNNFSGSLLCPKISIAPSPIVLPLAFAGLSSKFDVTIDYLRLVDAGGNEVDLVNNLTWLKNQDPFRPDITVPPAFPSPRVNGKVGGAECVDPRYNHINTCWFPYFLLGQPSPGAPGNSVAATNGTIGAVNAYTSFQLKKAGNDGHHWMHVADQPLQSTAELSYIVRGGKVLVDTWKTVRLTKEGVKDPDPIYTYFTVKPSTSPQRGFVNPNTRELEVLDAVFKNMKLNAYPHHKKNWYSDDINAVTVDNDKAKLLSDAWKNGVPLGGFTTNMTEMINNIPYISAVSSLLPTPALDGQEFRKEAGIRNLYGLLNPRQNFFIIALFAQSSAQVNLPVTNGVRRVMATVRSDQTGILELWRDPVGRVSGGVTNHPMLIRRFDILNVE